MARIRTIKPEFWEDEKIGRLPYPCRLMYIGMWNFADDYGFVKASASLLKSQIFPYDDNLRTGEVSKWIDALVKARMLVPVSHEGESYYMIRTFRSHQVIDKRYDKSFIGKGVVNEIVEKALGDHCVTTTCTHSEHAGGSPQEKEGKRKVNNSLSGEARAQEEDSGDGSTLLPLDALERLLRGSGQWLEAVAMQRGLGSSQEASQWLTKFLGELRIRGDDLKTYADAKRHFVSWLEIQLSKSKNTRHENDRPTDKDFTDAVAAGILRAHTPQSWQR